MSQRILVIGGGIVGLCSAYYLQRAGHKVTVLEKGKFLQGTSHGNAGMVVPSHFIPLAQPGMIRKGFRWMFDSSSPFYLKPRLSKDLMKWGYQFYRHSTKEHVDDSKNLLKSLNWESRKLHTELAELIGTQVESKGLIMYCKTKEGLDEEKEIADQARQLGLEVDDLTQEDLQQLEPNLKMNLAGGVHFKDDGFLTPGDLMKGLLKLLSDQGVKLVEDCEIERIEITGDRINAISSKDHMYVGDQYVISAGAFSTPLASKLKLDLLMQAGKGYSLDLADPIETPTICGILTEAKVAFTPMSFGLRFAGTMEIGGLNMEINQKRVDGIKKAIGEYFPSFKKQYYGPSVWSGLRPCSPDGLPYLGRSNAISNLIVATGHGMMGLSLGPVTGKLVAQLVDEVELDFDIAKLAVDRFN